MCLKLCRVFFEGRSKKCRGVQIFCSACRVSGVCLQHVRVGEQTAGMPFKPLGILKVLPFAFLFCLAAVYQDHRGGRGTYLQAECTVVHKVSQWVFSEKS